MSSELLNLLIELPLVGIFAYFVLKLLDKYEKSIADLWDKFIEATKERDEVWRNFLREEREHRTSAAAKERELRSVSTERLAEEIKLNREKIIRIDSKVDDVFYNQISSHDVKTSPHVDLHGRPEL